MIRPVDPAARPLSGWCRRPRRLDACSDLEGPARAIACAHPTIAAVSELGLDIRAGIPTDEFELVDGRVEGIAVHIGARAAAEARRCEVLGSSIEFEDRGVRRPKGVPGDWQLVRGSTQRPRE